jgi:hypothetical protein
MANPAETMGSARMPRVDAQRISWFLNLQRILRFPKCYMAPVAASPLSRGPAKPRSQTIIRAIPPLQSHDIIERIVRIATGAVSNLKRVTSPMNAPGGWKGPRTPTITEAERPVGRLSWQAPKRLPRVTVVPQTILRRDRAEVAVRETLVGSRRRHGLIGPFGNRPSAFRNSVSFAPATVSFPTQGRSNCQPDGRRGTNTAEIPEALRRQDIPPTNQQPLLTQGSGIRNKWLSPNPDLTPDGDRLRNNEPTLATLHIDGSALGRWAVQYLERALGKPATGMTGVDPRVTIPRSRVAPF